MELHEALALHEALVAEGGRYRNANFLDPLPRPATPPSEDEAGDADSVGPAADDHAPSANHNARSRRPHTKKIVCRRCCRRGHIQKDCKGPLPERTPEEWVALGKSPLYGMFAKMGYISNSEMRRLEREYYYEKARAEREAREAEERRRRYERQHLQNEYEKAERLAAQRQRVAEAITGLRGAAALRMAAYLKSRLEVPEHTLDEYLDSLLV